MYGIRCGSGSVSRVERLYHEFAHLWPLLSPPEDYAPEAACIERVLSGVLGAQRVDDGLDILEFGAGGGHTLYHLKARHRCVAVDLSEPMLKQCKKLNPEVQTVAGDMRDVELGETFDVVLIHDAIDYLTRPDDVQATLQNAHRHLRPDGVLLVAPTYVSETFEPGEETDDGSDEAGWAFACSLTDVDPVKPTFELCITMLPPGSDEPIEDVHVCGLFDALQWEDWVEQAGFDLLPVELGDDDPPWCLFVGKKN